MTIIYMDNMQKSLMLPSNQNLEKKDNKQTCITYMHVNRNKRKTYFCIHAFHFTKAVQKDQTF